MCQQTPQAYALLVPRKDMLQQDQEFLQHFHTSTRLLNKIALSYLQPLSIAFSEILSR
jgi:uncharacterized membrane-anchored protein YhcB (DUF1043 family)